MNGTKALALAILVGLGGCGGGSSATSMGVHQSDVRTSSSAGESGGYAEAEAPPMADHGGYAGPSGGESVAMDDMAAPPPTMAPSRATAPSRAAVTGGGAEGRMAAEPTARPVPGTTRASVRTTTTVTVTVDEPTVPVAPEPVVRPHYVEPQRLLTAASVGDHDRRDNYLRYLQRHPVEAQRLGLDMNHRVRFRVVDGQGQPVNDARLVLTTNQGAIEGRTHADGTWDYYRAVHGGGSGHATVAVEALNAQGTGRVLIPSHGDGQDVTVRLDHVQSQQQRNARILDLAFLIDVTGSMEDELRYVNREVTDIVARVRSEAPEARIRVGAIFYRDRSDSVPLQRIGFTEDIQGFASAMQNVRASGGGDYPEDLDSGLMTAMQGLQWSTGDAVRALITIADAPPKRYQSQYTYRDAMIEASRRGIRIVPVAASGADREVEFLFRAMGSFTASPYVYLTDDSGVGNPHREADTDRVAVEYFNDLLTRLLVSDLRGGGMHEPAGFDR